MRAMLLSIVLVVIATTTQGDLPKVQKVIRGEVVTVKDADTINIVEDHKLITVRLEGIDAPEKTQDYSAKATAALKSRIWRKTVSVHVTGKDKYGRTLGVVFLGSVNINAELIEKGWAWHYKEYNSDPQLAELELEARKAKRGIWIQDNIIPPWQFRELLKQRRALAKSRSKQVKPEKATPPPQPRIKPPPRQIPPVIATGYWLNTSSNVRHNFTCQYYRNTKRGRSCGANDGRACGICGG